jgi:hypothetical protein
MSSGQRYDDKQAYNKKLSSKARLHYLENEEHDKGMSRYEEGMSRYEEGMSRQASPLNDFKGGYHKVQHAKGEAHKGTSRKSSPANNVNYGTGYIGEKRYDDMKYNAVDDITQGKGKADYGMSRQSSPLNNEGHGGKKGHGHATIVKKTAKKKPIVNK